MGKIAVLSDALINKIAAGEVVERPASVIKELCENSIDAGATSVEVFLVGAGLTSITVLDDGEGMVRDDAVAALGRHATSKLRDLDGLFCIGTMGFRGEALPSIASVSRFTLLTGTGVGPGTRIQLEGGGPIRPEDAPSLRGTRIDVEELFFNTPARRKYLKRPQTELAHCEEAVVRLALSYPHVSFRVEHEGSPVFSSQAGGDLRERMAAALGGQVHAHLLPVEERRLGVTVTGYISSPELTLPTARGIYALVNRRYIRDRGLNHAIARAYRDALPPGRQPVAVLTIEVDPREVDVNVHPQKLEVRFADGRAVYDAVFAAISNALRSAPWMQAGQGGALGAHSGAGDAQAHYADAVERFLSRAGPSGLEVPGGVTPVEGAPGVGLVGGQGEGLLSASELAFGQARPGINEAPPPAFFSGLRRLGVLAKRFWVCEGPGGSLVVIDPHAAFERARLDELCRRILAPVAAKAEQAPLWSETIELSEAAAREVRRKQAGLEQLGLAVEPFGGRSFAVECTRALGELPMGAVLEELLAVLPADLPEASAAVSVRSERERWVEALLPALQVLACASARLESERALAEGELSTLLSCLDEADFGLPCRHGRVVVSEVSLLELIRRAGAGDLSPQ